MVDLNEFVDRYRQIISELRNRVDDAVREDLLTYLDTGEEGLAAEFLMDRLVLQHTPVTRAEAATLLELLQYFDMSPSDPEAVGFYGALADPAGAVAELTVVDEPSS